MKRDFDLIRDILISVERHEEAILWVSDVDWDESGVSYGFGDAIRRAHFDLMKEAGLVADCFHNAGQNQQTYGYRLTWAGYDYLDAIKDEDIWQKTKASVVANGGSVAFEVMKSIAVGFAKQKFSQYTGFELS
ncbi:MULTISPECIES: DUF2513 domain-containing protein [Pacificibacter]|uniref:DUF2513 domain-containing protein n=1 Tax=Pacificibacter TaxID=1042323 RepID=UPI001C0A60F3|nr:DUF2513 domain-containing protein [Pacificibacter sp. 1_MG-2023]MBU2937897.1 DUF2513 domain-containing protein [Pacificibacter marinus]MDO6617221.1 DUF2513 domain-containing protein [Pacificibacter sp. 1_MG-2023]